MGSNNKAKKKTVRKTTQPGNLVFRQLPMIEAWSKSKSSPQFRRQLLDLSPSTIKALGSVALNVLEGKIPLKSKKQKLVVEKNQNYLRQLARGSSKKQKQILQNGKFFPILASLIPAAISTIASLFSK